MATNDTTTRTLRIVKTLTDRLTDLERRVGVKPRATASMQGLSAYERTCRLVDLGRQNEIEVPLPPTRARRR